MKIDTLLNMIKNCGITAIGAMKIDVEGAKDKILQPFFSNSNKTLWPKLIVIEHLFPELWDWNCLDFLESSGYQRIWRGKMNTVYFLDTKPIQGTKEVKGS